MSKFQQLLNQIRHEKTAGEGPSDPPPMDQNQKNDSASLAQEMVAKIQNFLQAAQGAGAAAPPELNGQTSADPNAQIDPNAQQIDPNAQPQGDGATVTLQVPAGAMVKIGEVIKTKSQAINFLTGIGFLEMEKK